MYYYFGEFCPRVEKVVLKKGRAVGVRLQRFDSSSFIGANKEVIMSAGAIGSPQILMLSGIGPKEHLRDLGIPLNLDLPVGKNMQSHIGIRDDDAEFEHEFIQLCFKLTRRNQFL
jgi:choline dehydrogenase-like flavoprotein